MTRIGMAVALAFAVMAPPGPARQPGLESQYRVIKSAKVGGEGGFDYIYAEVIGRRLYIPRRAIAAVPATETRPAVAAVEGRVTVFDLDTLKPIGEVPDTGGNGVAVDVKSGHGFSSSKPVSMFDVKTLKLIKKIDVGAAVPDGILFDGFNDRVYVFSHPTKNAIVIDAKSGDVVGTIDLGGVPEQAVSDGRGTIYVVMQDAQGSVTVVDAGTMKATAHYPFGDNGGCNGLALDLRNRILFAACARAGSAPQPAMIVLKADDGTILTRLPLAGSSDGAVFNAATLEVFSSHSNGTMTIVQEKSPTAFEVVQNLQTMPGARTLTFDSQTNRILTMSVERGPAPPPPPDGGRAGQAPVIPGSFTILVIGR